MQTFTNNDDPIFVGDGGTVEKISTINLYKCYS